ncbi:Hypothetical protein, putative [Bodo saltans]|nr:Hypothetical protein, putative [Bodo saltans]|eukprot:CUG84248.1 Hypothetical protein, putative [Bodo saltans]
MDAEPPSAHPHNNQTITAAPFQESATPSSRISRSESPKELGFVPSIEPAGYSPNAVDATRALGFVSWTEDEAEVQDASPSSTAPLHQQQKRDEYDFFAGTATIVQTQHDDDRDEGVITERRVDSLFPMSSPNPDAQYDFTATHQLSDYVADSSGALVSSSPADAQNNDNNLVDPFVEHHSVPHTYGSSALSFANDDDDDDDLR